LPSRQGEEGEQAPRALGDRSILCDWFEENDDVPFIMKVF
jgi:hypothetical protein